MFINLMLMASAKRNIHPATMYKRFNMFFSSKAIFQLSVVCCQVFFRSSLFSKFYFFVSTIRILFGGVPEGWRPRFSIAAIILLSILACINSIRTSTYSLFSSLTSAFSFEILCTFLSAVCELPIIIKAKTERKMMKRQFFKASSLTKNFPFIML